MILAAHCGYLGVVPQPFATEWALRKKVLAIVNDNATASSPLYAEAEAKSSTAATRSWRYAATRS